VAELDVAANVATAGSLVRRAGAAGAALVVLPEMFLTGYRLDAVSQRPGQYAFTADDPRLDEFRSACAEAGAAAVVGAATYEAGSLRISALVVGPDGASLGRYDKQHLDAAELAAGFTPGARGCTLLLDGWRLGLGICWDSSFPEHARAAALDGCQAYVLSALFDRAAGVRKRRIIPPARSWDNACYVVVANHCARSGPYEGCGGSGVWDPAGDLVADAGPDGPALAVAQLDPAAAVRARAGDLPMDDPSLDVPVRERDVLLVR
jgi:predicted amidohydrolase